MASMYFITTLVLQFLACSVVERLRLLVLGVLVLVV